jgi:hypothetical protein
MSNQVLIDSSNIIGQSDKPNSTINGELLGWGGVKDLAITTFEVGESTFLPLPTNPVDTEQALNTTYVTDKLTYVQKAARQRVIFTDDISGLGELSLSVSFETVSDEELDAKQPNDTQSTGTELDEAIDEQGDYPIIRIYQLFSIDGDQRKELLNPAFELPKSEDELRTIYMCLEAIYASIVEHGRSL